MNPPGDSYYQPERSALQQILRALSASFRLGRFLGVEVRVYWITLILMPLIFLSDFRGFPFLEALTHTALWTVLLYVVIWAHEMGHILMGRRYGMHTPLITLSPLGGIAHMATPAPRPSAEAWVSLAGPATHLLWLAVLAPLWYLGLAKDFDFGRPDGWFLGPIPAALYFLVQINFWLMCFNLLPFFPMDGGRVLRALLARKMHPNRATLIATQVGIAGAVLFIISWLVFPFMGQGWILFAIGLSNLFACLQERKIARFTHGPYDGSAGRAAWQADPDGWKRAGGPGGKPGFLARRRVERDRRRQAGLRAARTELEDEVDRILAKVSEVGMAGLTEREKKSLMRASAERKKR